MAIIVIMIEPDLSLQKPLEDYVEYIDKLNIRSIPLLSEMFASSISLSDPYYNVNGAQNICKILEQRFKVCHDARYKVIDFMWGRREAIAYIYWNFIYRPNKKAFLLKKDNSEFLNIDVMCEVKFLPNGEIFSHSEFWGEHNAFAAKEYQQQDLLS